MRNQLWQAVASKKMTLMTLWDDRQEQRKASGEPPQTLSEPEPFGQKRDDRRDKRQPRLGSQAHHQPWGEKPDIPPGQNMHDFPNLDRVGLLPATHSQVIHIPPSAIAPNVIKFLTS
jgi:hypothetical protein